MGKGQNMTGKEFKAKREMMGWTQKQAAQAFGVTIPQISGIENGRSGVSKTMAILFDLYEFGEWPGDLPMLLDEGRKATGRPARTLLGLMT
jgi:transcriptional regulator with XRE-family HTH domain